MSEVQNVHLFNCDKTYKFDAVEVWLEKEKSKQAFSVQRHYFSLAEMFEISNETIPGLNMDLAVFVIHANDSYWSIDEENGYTIIYRSLLQKTGDNVIVVIGGDDNYRNEEEENKEFISRWAKRKVPSQFKDEYMDGRKGFILSWNEKHREIHEEVLRHFLDPSKRGTKFEYKPKLSSRPETEKKDGCQQSKRDSFSEDKKRANQDFSSIEGFVMLRSRLKFGRLTNDVEIHYPGFNVPHCLAQGMYETHRNTSDVVVEVRSDGRGGYAWFPSTKRSLVSLGEDETVVLKTRLCNGLISQEKGKLEFIYPGWKAPTYLIADLRKQYQSCPDRELFVISNEKGNLRWLVFKEGRLDSIKKFFWSGKEWHQ